MASQNSDPSQNIVDLKRIENERIHKEKFYAALEAQKFEEELKPENERTLHRFKNKEEYNKMIEEIEQAKKN
jgi:hypothetical protein